MSGGKMRSGSALCARYLASRIVAVADGLTDAGRGVGVLIGVPGGCDEPAGLAELTDEAPGTVTREILRPP